VVITGDGVAVDVVTGTAVGVGAVDNLVDSEQATHANAIVVTSSAAWHRVTRDRCAGTP
jgi:hydrogenase maturation factor